MKEFYTDIAKKQKGVRTLADGSDICGEMLVSRTIYTVEQGVAVGDVILLVKVPMGARIIPSLSHVISEGVGTNFKLKIGIKSNDGLYASEVDAATAGKKELAGGEFNDVTLNSEYDAWVIATVTAVSGATVGKRLRFVLTYVIN